MWWILIAVLHPGTPFQVTNAVGPYPSAEVCRLAGKSMMPSDERFWTPEEVANQRRHDAEERVRQEAAHRERVAAAKAKAKGRPFTVDDPWNCRKERYDAAGKLIEGSGDYGCISINAVTEPRAVTGCVKVEESNENK